MLYVVLILMLHCVTLRLTLSNIVENGYLVSLNRGTAHSQCDLFLSNEFNLKYTALHISYNDENCTFISMQIVVILWFSVTDCLNVLLVHPGKLIIVFT